MCFTKHFRGFGWALCTKEGFRESIQCCRPAALAKVFHVKTVVSCMHFKVLPSKQSRKVSGRTFNQVAGAPPSPHTAAHKRNTSLWMTMMITSLMRVVTFVQHNNFAQTRRHYSVLRRALSWFWWVSWWLGSNHPWILYLNESLCLGMGPIAPGPSQHMMVSPQCPMVRLSKCMLIW